MTTEDRRLVAALTTEVAEQRRVLEALVRDVEFWFRVVYLKNPDTLASYCEAKELLK